MYKLEFEPTDLGRKRYEMCFQAFALTDMQIPVAKWDDAVDLGRCLKSIGIEAKEKVAGVHLRDLFASGGTIQLERACYNLLLEMIERPIWRPMNLEDARELVDWLKSLSNDGGSKAVDAKPEAKRRALEKV